METPKKLDPKRELWEIQPKETHKAARAFSLYLAFGADRSMQKVADRLQCSYNNVRKWYERWSWMERTAAYEAHLMSSEIKKLETNRLSMRKRHLSLAKALQVISSAQVRAWQEEVQAAVELREVGDPDWKKHLPNLAVADVLKLAEIGMKNERLVYGDPTENTEMTVKSKEISSLEEEIKEYMHLFDEDEE